MPIFARIQKNLFTHFNLNFLNILQQFFQLFISAAERFLMEEIINLVGLSAIVSAGNPIQTIKSRIQTTHQLFDKGTIHRKYLGIIDCIKTIKLNQGIKGLWKGNLISVLRFFPNEKINNDVKNAVKQKLPQNVFCNFISGVLGGWTAAAILYPFDTTRVILATSVQKSTETVKQISKKIASEGYKFLFRGYSSSLINIALFRGTYFGVFDSLKDYTTNTYQKWMVAYLSGISAGLIVYPVETLRKKKIIQCKNTRYSEIIRKTVCREGPVGFYRGCTLIPLQSLSGAAVLMYFDQKRPSA